MFNDKQSGDRRLTFEQNFIASHDRLMPGSKGFDAIKKKTQADLFVQKLNKQRQQTLDRKGVKSRANRMKKHRIVKVVKISLVVIV